ncbi:MAG: 50S ribosomal protein L6 [Chloroflexi bacterium]|nr:50S ribosomal protein L6 [Chloroflexota bacterium]
MSRIGRTPITIPQGVQVDIADHRVTVTGPGGTLSRAFPRDMLIDMRDGQMVVSRPSDGRRHRSLHGLTRTLLANMVQGVTAGFQKRLELSGVGYRAQKVGEKLVFQLGFSHPVEMPPPPGVSFSVEGTNRVTVSGIDKELVGEVAAAIRRVRRWESYQGKGIRYAEERIRLKAGKAGAKKKGK